MWGDYSRPDTKVIKMKKQLLAGMDGFHTELRESDKHPRLLWTAGITQHAPPHPPHSLPTSSSSSYFYLDKINIKRARTPGRVVGLLQRSQLNYQLLHRTNYYYCYQQQHTVIFQTLFFFFFFSEMQPTSETNNRDGHMKRGTETYNGCLCDGDSVG